MKKSIALLMTFALVMTLLAGCTGTTVVIGNCTCPPGSHDGTEDGGQSNQPTLSEGSLKTGLAITTTVSDSVNATAGKDGEVKYDVTIAAVLVDDAGVIQIIDISEEYLVARLRACVPL